MSLRAVGALLSSLAGVAVPVVFLLTRYGLNDRVSGSTVTTTQFLELLGTMAVAFVGGLIAAVLLRSSAPTLGQVLRDALNEAARNRGRAAT
jgi:hypothetical protein